MITGVKGLLGKGICLRVFRDVPFLCWEGKLFQTQDSRMSLAEDMHIQRPAVGLVRM